MQSYDPQVLNDNSYYCVELPQVALRQAFMRYFICSQKVCSGLYILELSTSAAADAWHNRNQKNIIATFPTSYAYISPGKREYPWESFVQQFEWNATINFPAYLTIPAALEFRKSIGGEKAINDYCQTLAIEGGKRLAGLLGTTVLDPRGEFTMHMVCLPHKVPFYEFYTRFFRPMWLFRSLTGLLNQRRSQPYLKRR